jgi:predicted PurR-regulated permease PerM
MNEPARPASDAGVGPGSVDWVASLPPPPFVLKPADGSPPRFAPLSPRVAVLLAAAVVVGVLLWMAQDSVRPFIVGLLFVYLLDIPIRWLVRRGLRRSLAIILVYIATFVIIVEFLALTLTPLVNEILRFIEDFPKLAESLNARLQDLTELYSRLEIPVAIRDWIDGVIASIGNGGEVGAGIDLSFLLPLVTGAGSLIGAIFGYVLLPVWVFYLLKDRVSLAASFDRSLPAAWHFDTMVVLRSVERVLSQWVRAQFVLGLTVGVFTFVGLLVLSRVVDPIFGRYAILLSVTAGILELLPIIGPIISAVPAVLLAATAGPESVIAALILYTLVQQVENNFLVPKIQGDAVELHPAAVMFAIIIGGALGGLIGAILALPVAAAGRDVVRYLFRRVGPDEDPASLAAIVRGVGMAPEAATATRTAPGPAPVSGEVGAADA